MDPYLFFALVWNMLIILRYLFIVVVVVGGAKVFAETKLAVSSNKCHDITSPYYSNVQHYISYDSLDACASNIGYGTVDDCVAAGMCYVRDVNTTNYDREGNFGRWTDEDSNCLNTRHQLLAIASRGNVIIRDCKVVGGLWMSPFTNNHITDPSVLEIDHIVPLKHAWMHGADQWDHTTRVQFANDTDNLWPVEGNLNSQKSDQGLEWLPPQNQCQYILKFLSVAHKYRLTYTPEEKTKQQALRQRHCRF
jgi:hypothetical protein